MAIVHLEFDLDSNVYPELHAALSVLRSPQAQTERVRQLATLGLVWENVRIYGAAAIGPTPTGDSLVGTASAPASAPLRAKRGGKPKRADLELPAPADDERALAAAHSSESDFVNLAIDVDEEHTSPASALEGRHPVPLKLSQREVEQVARELPVLIDIVNDSDNDGGLDLEPALEKADTVKARGRRAAAPSVPPKKAAAPVEDPALEALASVSDDAVHLTSLAEKPAMRSRLLRMKERGLFKNG
ncbi:MAG: hypothetical protein V4739_14930 [Pseudomonadota bacterium]